MDLPAIKLATANPVKGDTVIAIGSPGVDAIAGGVSENSVDVGTLGNPHFRLKEDNLLYFQHSAKINPGNSGGPLINSRAEVVGVNVAGFKSLDGIKLAIPLEEVRAILDKACARGTVAIDQATAKHDALLSSEQMVKTCAFYIKGTIVCLEAARLASDKGIPPAEAMKQRRKLLEQEQIKDNSKIIHPRIAQIVFLGDYENEITDIITGSTLDPELRGKIRRLREVYERSRALFNDPPERVDDLIKQFNAIILDFKKLKESLAGEFANVF